MLDMKLFRNPLFSTSSAAVTIAFFALGGAFYLLAQLIIGPDHVARPAAEARTAVEAGREVGT